MPSCGDGGGPAPVDGDVTVTLPLKTLHEVVAALEADRPPKRPTRLRLLRALVDGSDGALTLSQCLVRAAPATSAARAAALVVTKESCPTTPTESDAEFEPSGTAAPPVPPILIPPRLQLPSPKRAASAVVLVGCGEVARLYAHCLAGRCHYLITAVCDPDIAAATALAAHVNARQTQLYANAPACLVTASVAELVKCVPAEQRRLAVNLTPTQHHYTSTTELLLAGCHVWSEKPLAETVAEATELVQLASECGLELGCSPVSFWGAAQQTVARQLMRGAGARCNDAATAEEADHARSDSGALGTVRMCTASVLCGSWMPAADRIGGWLQHRRFRVGSLRDVAVYPLAVLTALFGPAVKVAAIVTAAMVAAHVDAWTVTVEFSTGATAIITSSLSLSAPAGDAAYGMTLRGDRGSLTLKALWNDDTGVTLLPDGGEDGAGLLRDVPLWRPPYASPPNAPPHPHACDWGCGIDLLAQSVDDSAALFNAEPDADVGPQARARHRTFTGAHGVHLVDMLEMAEASAAAPDHPSLGLTTTFDWPLPMPPPHALADALFGARRMSRVVLGTMRLAEISNPLAFLDAAWNLGCNTFDLAHVYGAKVEGIVGKWLAQRVGDHCTDSSRLLRPPLPGRPIGRADIILVGKGGHPYRDSRDKARLSHANLEKDITESLVRLGTDYLDVFLIHRDDPAAFPDVCVYARGIRFGVAAPAYGHCPLVDCGLESPQWPSDVLETIVGVIVESMCAIVQSGKCRSWGTSNWSLERVKAAVTYADFNDHPRPVAVSDQLSLAVPRQPVWDGCCHATTSTTEYCNAEGIALLAWAPLAEGYMCRALRRSESLQSWETPQNQIRRDRLYALAEARGKSPAEVALAYVLHAGATAVVAGVSSVARMQSAVRATQIALTKVDVAWLAAKLHSDTLANTHTST